MCLVWPQRKSMQIQADLFDPNMGNPKFLVISKSYGNHTQICGSLIILCLFYPNSPNSYDFYLVLQF